MALYAYRCPTHADFEVEASMDTTQPQEHCPICGGLCPKILVGALQFTYGKEDFHGDTVRQRDEKFHATQESFGRKLGRDYDRA